jgi:hypothetical protein
MTETDFDETIMTRSGSGKTTTTIELFARVHDEGTMEWIDPNGDADTQKLSGSRLNPLDVDQLNSSTDSDAPTGHGPAVFGKVGRGKTERFGTALVKAVYDESVRQGNPDGFVAVNEIESTEFIEKGDETNSG